MSQSPFEMLEENVVDLMRQAKAPGISIGIILNRKLAYNEGFGTRDLEKNIPMTPDTLYGIGSISKSFGALAIMKLYEQGELDLQDPVNKYVPFKLGEKENPIRIHHVISHTSRYGEKYAHEALMNRLVGGFQELRPMTTWKDFWIHINGAKGEKFAEPGSIFCYNNDIFGVVDPIVEKVAKMPYINFVRENILDSLEMHKSTYIPESFKEDSDRITGYMVQDGIHIPNLLPMNILGYGTGGFARSVNEMFNYASMLINQGEFKKNPIIKKDTWKKLLTPNMRVEDDTNIIQEGGYGYGWFVDQDFFGTTMIRHGGDFHVCGSEIALLPDKKMGVIAGVNRQPGPIFKILARGVLATLLGKDFNEVIGQIMPPNPYLEKLKRLTGKNCTYKGILNAEIKLKDGFLVATTTLPPALGGTQIFPLIPYDMDKLIFTIQMGPGIEMIVKILEYIDKKVTAMFHRYIMHKIQ